MSGRWDEESPLDYLPYVQRYPKYAAMRDAALASRRKYGNDVRMRFDNNLPKLTMEDFSEDEAYKGSDLEAFADDLLRQDARRELCRKCRKKDKSRLPYGVETGYVEPKPQYDPDTNQPILDEEGNQLYLEFPEFQCDKGHRWFAGEGERRNWDGPNSVLMEEHLNHRRRREIYVQSEEAMGKPEPSIVSGIYNRVHKDGRKVNSKEQRKRNGASFFR
jgi:hypothetical protein